MKFLIDSSAWVEYLEGSSAGEKVDKILQDENKIYTFPIVVSEVVSKSKRSGNDSEIAFRAIMSNSKYLDVTPGLSKEAGLFHADMKKKKKNFGLADAFIWVVAEKLGAKLVTCDNHFNNFKNVVFLK